MTPRGPADLVAAVPRALGREPADEVIVIGVSDGAPSAALVASVPLGDRDRVALVDALSVGSVALASDGAVAVAVLVYAPDALDPGGIPARAAATVHVLAQYRGLRVLDAVAVTENRWRSYTCETPSCCPPEGHPLPEEQPAP